MLKKSRYSEQKGTRQSLPCAHGRHKMPPWVSFLQKSNWRVWIRALKMEDDSYRMPFTEGRQDIIRMMSEEALPTPPAPTVRFFCGAQCRLSWYKFGWCRCCCGREYLSTSQYPFPYRRRFWQTATADCAGIPCWNLPRQLCTNFSSAPKSFSDLTEIIISRWLGQCYNGSLRRKPNRQKKPPRKTLQDGLSYACKAESPWTSRVSGKKKMHGNSIKITVHWWYERT